MKTSTALVKAAALLIAVAAVAGGLVIYAGLVPVGADVEHRPFSQWLLQTARERSVARAARAVEVNLPRQLDDGALLSSVASFEDMCAGCHAPPGRAETALARGLNPPAPDLAQAALERTPAELFWVTRHGIRMTAMPAWGKTHADDQLWPLVALIQRLPDMDGDQYARLLVAAREAGATHDHGHDDAHDQSDVHEEDPGEHRHEDDHAHDRHDHEH